MPGFVDVSNMTSEEIRQMDHAADYDGVPEVVFTRGFHKFYQKHNKPKFFYEGDRVWGASVVAFRANKGYVKALGVGLATKTNRQIVDDILQNNVEILDTDMAEGREIRQYFKGLMFKKLEGKPLSPFLTGAMEVASKDQITDSLGVGIIASLPATYQKMTVRDDVDRRIKWANGGFIGSIGDKTTEKIEIIKKLWSNNYNTWYFTGINDKDQVLFFAHKGDFEIGTYVTIEGKVKSHRENSTQLSHVKVI